MMSTIFFYGLFMDQALLEERGLNPSPIGSATLSDYKIHIGSRATLVPSAGSTAYGIVMKLPAEEAKSLYAEPSVRDYRPEPVRVHLIDTSEAVETLCYNLPGDAAVSGTNSMYARQLSRLALELGFDPEYADEISRFAART